MPGAQGRSAGEQSKKYRCIGAILGSDQNATVARAEGKVLTPRTGSVRRGITGWKRLLGRFVEVCIFSPQYLRLGTKPVVKL